MAGWVAGWIRKIIIPLRGPSCKLGFARISDRLKFQDEPSVAINTMLSLCISMFEITQNKSANILPVLTGNFLSAFVVSQLVHSSY